MKYRYNCSAYIFESKVIKNEILDPALKGCLSRDNVASKLSHIALYEINTILNTRVQIALKDLKEKEEVKLWKQTRTFKLRKRFFISFSP